MRVRQRPVAAGSSRRQAQAGRQGYSAVVQCPCFAPQRVPHVHRIVAHGAAAKDHEPNRAANRGATERAGLSTRPSQTVEQPAAINQSWQHNCAPASPACAPHRRARCSSQGQRAKPGSKQGSRHAHQLLQHVHQVVAYGAAQAAVVEHHDLRLGRVQRLLDCTGNVQDLNFQARSEEEPLSSIMVCSLAGSSASSTAQEKARFDAAALALLLWHCCFDKHKKGSRCSAA